MLGIKACINSKKIFCLPVAPQPGEQTFTIWLVGNHSSTTLFTKVFSALAAHTLETGCGLRQSELKKNRGVALAQEPSGAAESEKHRQNKKKKKKDCSQRSLDTCLRGRKSQDKICRKRPDMARPQAAFSAMKHSTVQPEIPATQNKYMRRECSQ